MFSIFFVRQFFVYVMVLFDDLALSNWLNLGVGHSVCIHLYWPPFFFLCK